MTLTKADIVAQVYAQGQLTKAEAAEAVEQGLELIKQALSTGEEVLAAGLASGRCARRPKGVGATPRPVIR